MLLHDALDRYVKNHILSGSSGRTIETVRDRVGRFVNPRADVHIRKIKKEDIALHFRELTGKGLAESTLAGHRSSIRAFFKFCKKKKWIKKNPAKILNKRQYAYSFDPVVRRPANEDDFQSVIDAIPAFLSHRGYRQRDIRDALTVSLAIDSGARRGEIWSLKRVDVVRALKRGPNKRGVYHVHSYGKTKGVKLRFFEATAGIVRLWLEKLDPTAVWLFENSKTGERFRADYLGDSFIRICEFVNVPVFRFQATRKRDIVDIIEASGDANVGKGFANHNNVTTTQRYYNMIEDDAVDRAASELANKRRGNSVGHSDINKLFGIE